MLERIDGLALLTTIVVITAALGQAPTHLEDENLGSSTDGGSVASDSITEDSAIGSMVHGPNAYAEKDLGSFLSAIGQHLSSGVQALAAMANPVRTSQTIRPNTMTPPNGRGLLSFRPSVRIIPISSPSTGPGRGNANGQSLKPSGVFNRAGFVRPGVGLNDDQGLSDQLGLFSGVDDLADNMGPPQIKPLSSPVRPSDPSESTSKPVLRTGQMRLSGNSGNGPLKDKPFSKPTPDLDYEDIERDRPTTPSGKKVGKFNGKKYKIIDGERYSYHDWELSSREALEMQAKPQVNLKMLGTFTTDPVGASSLATYLGPTKNEGLFSFYESAYKNKWNDPMWSLQWYLHDYRTRFMPVMDMNVVPAWELGYTGKNIKIAVIGDGVMHGHPDLAPNHLIDLSYDYELDKPGSQPAEPLSEHSHATKCASQISMVAGNGLCGVGIAYDAKIAGVRNSVDKLTTAFLEGRTFTHRLQEIDISSNSYGPIDDGIMMQRAPHLTYMGFLKGVMEGRSGRGIVYVFPAGNGRRDGDHCGADAFMNTRYTIGIAAASQRGKVSEYSERCAGIIATTYSGGNQFEEKVVTVEMNNNCNDTFVGTSAAVPHASAIIALLLEANPMLTYRDVMHIITMGAEVAPLADNEKTWQRNGAGFWVSHDFGFGLLNAKNMVFLAKRWKPVLVEHNSCVKRFPITNLVGLRTGRTATVEVFADGCPGERSVQWIENVELEMSIHFSYRGALSISLISPYGTTSNLLEIRKNDNGNGMRQWVFRTVHHWGETPNGQWTLKVTANTLKGIRALSGSLDEAIISFHGMASDPPHQSALPRTYAAFRLPDGRTSEDKLVSRDRPAR